MQKPVQKVRRYNKEDKQNVEISFSPNAVITYNKFMGGDTKVFLKLNV